MSNFTPEKIEEETRRIVKEELENFFRMSRPGFTISSGSQSLGHGVSEFCLTTDSTQGIHFYKQGNVKMKAVRSFELYSGFDPESDKAFSIVFDAKRGNIELFAHDGNVVVNGNDVKVHASDTLQLAADRIVHIKAPSIQLEGESVSTVGILELKNLGGSLEQHSESSGAETSGGEDNLANTDLISRIINLIDEIEKLLIFAP